jgi:hypothetical protein
VTLGYTGAPIRVIILLVTLDWIRRHSANCSRQDRALGRFIWQALEGYWWWLVPWVPHKLGLDRINMEGRHESANQQGFCESYFLPLWLETQRNLRRQIFNTTTQSNPLFVIHTKYISGNYCCQIIFLYPMIHSKC